MLLNFRNWFTSFTTPDFSLQTKYFFVNYFFLYKLKTSLGAPWKLPPRKLPPEKLPPRKFPPRKLPPMKIAPYENTQLWKFLPLKIPPSENRPLENCPQKINPKKIAPSESLNNFQFPTIVVRNWKLLPCSGGHGFRGSIDTYLIWYG